MYLLEKSSSTLGLMQLLPAGALGNILEVAEVLLIVDQLLLDIRQHLVLSDEALTLLLTESIDGFPQCREIVGG